MAEFSSLNGYKVKDSTARSDIEKINSDIIDINSQVRSLASGSPLVASSTSEMIDTNKTYVNTTDGYWYYYDGDSWEQGGIYQASEDSKTLNKLADIVNWDNDYNLFDTNARIPHALLNTHGEISYQESDSQYYDMTVSDKIPVSDFDYIVFRYMKPTTFCFYNADNTLLERLASSDASINEAHSTTRNNTLASYIRISYNTANTSYPFNKAMVYGTNDSTDIEREYVPYNNSFIKEEHLPNTSNNINVYPFEPIFYPTGIKQASWRGNTYAMNNDTGYISPYAPENSFPSFRKAIEEKMDFLWLAVIRYSSDMKFYVMHDPTTGRTCDQDINIAESTSTQIDSVKLTQKGWITWSDNDLKIPKFIDVVKLALQNNINLGIRIGALPNEIITPSNKAIWDEFISICRRYNLNNCIYSGDITRARILTSYEPNWHVQVTGSSSNTEQENIDLIVALANENFNRSSIILYKQNLTEFVMQTAKENNIYVFAVADEPVIQSETLAQYKDLCVDGIITHTHIDME